MRSIWVRHQYVEEGILPATEHDEPDSGYSQPVRNSDGWCFSDGNVCGTYVHGVFDMEGCCGCTLIRSTWQKRKGIRLDLAMTGMDSAAI